MKNTVPRMKPEELQDFVRDYLARTIWTSADVPKNLLPVVFMPVALGAMSGWTKKQLAQIGCVWAQVGKDRTAGGLGINGIPIFVSCRLMHAEDWKIAKATIIREQKQRTEIKLEPAGRKSAPSSSGSGKRAGKTVKVR